MEDLIKNFIYGNGSGYGNGNGNGSGSGYGSGNGRLNFAKNHSIDIDNDSLTVDEFIRLTKNEYGGDTIKKLIKA